MTSKISAREERLIKNTFVDLTQMNEFCKNPVIMTKGQGLYCWDKDDKRYFDAIGGIFVMILGHRHPRVIEAMKKQMDRLTFSAPMHSLNDMALDLVEKIGQVSPGNLNYVKPYSGGSLSIESALKFTRQYHKQTGNPLKYKFIGRYLGFHGSTYGAMSASGTGRRKTLFEPLLTGFLRVFPPTHYRDQFSDWDECNRFSAKAFEDVIIHEDPKTIAGIIVEPIGNTGGMITPTTEYYRMLRDICDRYNVTLIFDEIITGFAKTGAMFAAQAYGVTPDIICSGKSLGAGHIPLGSMIAREDMGEVFLGQAEDAVEFMHGNTFAGNPLACAAGLAVLDEIIENDLCKKAQRLGDYLVKKLDGLRQYGVIRDIRGKGVLRGVEFMRDEKTLAPFPELGQALKQTALKNGLIMRIDPNWFALCPPLIAEESDIDEMYELIEKSFKEALDVVQSNRKETK